MSTLVSTRLLSKSYGSKTLFERISFAIGEKDRIGLLGPNGSGKSTLLKILTGLEPQDFGEVSKRQGLRIGYAAQVPDLPDLPLEELLIANRRGDFHEMSTRARILLGKAQFVDFNVRSSTLSGGWKKRLDIVRALMQEPDLLLLDEPTNHLDLEGILWLEKFLSRERFAYLVVSHDRYFLENVANRIIELNPSYPQGLFASEGSMRTFQVHKEAFLAAERERERSLAGQLRTEIEWLRKSPKARTTKSQSRIDRAYELMDEHGDVKRRNKVAHVQIEFSASERETRKLLVGKNLAKTVGDKLLFKGLDITLSPRSRLGIVGKNGTGKTTLLKILAKELAPDMGTLKCADDLKIVYFDQHREKIAPKTTLKEALAPTGDMVNYRGQEIHVNGWAQKFLFSKDRLNLPVDCLSGGERARIQIAKLMLMPADLLFLDEPTNDLDISTLEVIEESLKDFPGAVVLISHDRCLMDRVCTQIVALGEGEEPRFFADYTQFERGKAIPAREKEEPKKGNKEVKPSREKKLLYAEQQELDGMEQAIMRMEKEIALLAGKIKEAPQAELYTELARGESHLEALFNRWQFLIDKRNGS